MKTETEAAILQVEAVAAPVAVSESETAMLLKAATPAAMSLAAVAAAEVETGTETAMPLEAETPAAKTLAAVAAAEVETGTETAVLTKAETFAAMMLMLEAAVPAAEVGIAKLVEPESPAAHEEAEVDTAMSLEAGMEAADAAEARAETALPLKAGTEAGTAIPLKIVAAAPQTLLQLLDLYIFRFHLNRCIPFPTNNELNILSFYYTHKYINLNQLNLN